MDKIHIPCVILAGGKSSRMGEDKTQMNLGGISLTQWTLRHLSSIFEQVYISAKTQDKFAFDASFLIESESVFAPMVGIYNAFISLKDAQEICFVSVDTPFVTSQTFHAIAQTQADIVYAQTLHKAHYLISKWHSTMLSALEWALDSQDYALHRIVATHTHQGIQASEEECLNINTKHDYLLALQHHQMLQQ